MKFYLFNDHNGYTDEVTKEKFKNEAAKQGVNGASVSFYNPKTRKGGFISDLFLYPHAINHI